MPSNSNSKHTPPPPILTYETSPTTNTTFVQADPSNFRAVVQKLTGSSSTATTPPHPAGHTRPTSSSFKLHERRQAMRKLEMIKLNNGYNEPSSGLALASPVSTLGGWASPIVNEDVERAIIAEKGFYLHQIIPFTSSEPKLLPLFPLHSPRENCHH